VNAKELVKGEEELRLFAPLGCGIQTGAGTVVNVAKASTEDTVCVIGLGGVGLSAVMGAALCGCRTIIGIDRVASRLEIARELGCSHVIDTSGLKDLGDVVEEVRKVTDGYGTSITVDTTGLQRLIEAGVEFTSNRGQYIQVGSTMPNQKIQIPIQQFMGEGKRFIGAVEGQVIPQEFVPKMISWYREGRFPVDKLVKLFRAKDFADALEEMHNGSTIKPVITWT
jgi:Zn-dependent alcohol dehydrogenase